MDPRVYIETTIPSFYHEVRTKPEMLARRAWTREWWDDHRSDFDLVTSEAVLDELENGEFPQKGDALALLERIPLLDIDEAIADIVDAYIKPMSCRPILLVTLCIWQSHRTIAAISC